MRRAALLLLLLVAALLVAPAAALEGYEWAVEVAYSPGSGPDYQQDVVIHREVGGSYEELRDDGTRVWHLYVGDRCRSDYGDIRFTAAGTEIPYYRWPGWSDKTAEMTVKIPHTGPVQMWYGCLDAISTSNGPETFILFEDFENPGSCGFTGIGTYSLQTGDPGYSGYGLQSAAYHTGSWATTYWEAQREVVLPNVPIRVSVMSTGRYLGDGYDTYHSLAVGETIVAGYTLAPGWREISAANITAPGTQPVRLLSRAYWHTGVMTSSWDSLIIRSDDPSPPAALSFAGSPAHLTASPVSGPAPLVVRLTDLSGSEDDERFWDFGDGEMTFEPESIQYHIYTEPGTYTVNASVINPSGVVDHATATIRVVEGEPGTWGVYRDVVGAPVSRETGAYGAVALPDGGAAWIEMTASSSGLDEQHIWSALPQYWRVVRSDAWGGVVWTSEEYNWQRAGMSFGGGGYNLNAPEWYDPDIVLLDNGNVLVYDSVPGATLLGMTEPAGSSPPRSWLREIDAQTGATIWTSEISGWAVTGVVARSDGGYWASAGNIEGWQKPSFGGHRANPPEASYVLDLDATGSVTSSWRIHTEATRTHSMSHPFSIAPITGSDGDYWIMGWKSVSNQVYDNNPFYSATLLPQLDKINPDTRTDARYPLEQDQTYDTSIGSIPRAFVGGHSAQFTGYYWGRPNEITRLVPTSDGGALVSYSLIYEPTAKLVRVSPGGGKVWTKAFTSPITGEDIPVVDMVEAPGGAILVLLQDGDMLRVNRLDAAGNVQQTALVGDPGAQTVGHRIVSAPTEGHPYGCVITGSTSGFGASGTDALVVRLDDLADVINLGSGGLALTPAVAYASEDVTVTATLDAPLWDSASYWISVVGEAGTLYETLDLVENETEHILLTHAPPGNYTLTLNAYSDDYGILQSLATAHLVRLDVGEVEWGSNVTYLGGSPAIGYAYIPNYETYSYWIEVRDPNDLPVEIHRLPIPGGMALYVNPGNMTAFGTYTAELFPIRKSDDHRIPGNTSTILLSDDTWLSGYVADLYHYAIPNATVSVRQPTHPDPDVAARVLSGTSGPDGSYLVSGLVPRYPANVTVSAPGYYDHIETLNVNVSGQINYPVYLTAIPPPPLPEIVGKAVFPPRNNPAVGYEIVCENSTTTLTETSRATGHFSFPPLAPDIEYRVYARNATGHVVSQTHTYALGRGQTVDLLLEIRDESLLPKAVDFSARPTGGAAPLTVAFSATGTNVTTWHWDFGDGFSSGGWNITHVYNAGLWDVILTAENYYGAVEVKKERFISVTGGSGVPVQAPTRFVIQTYSGQPLANISVTATPLESTGPWAWLLDLFGISGAVDINGTVLSGSTDTSGGIVLPMIRSVKYRVAVTDPSRGIDTEITVYPQEDEILISVWPQEIPGPANDFDLYAKEEAGGTRVGVRYSSTDLTRITFRVTTEAGEIIAQKISTAQVNDLSHVIDGTPGEVYIYGYVAEHRTAGELRRDQFIRFAGEGRPLVDFAPWIPLWVYQWASIFILVGFSWTFGRGEIRGGMLTIPIIAGILQIIGWLQIPWMIVAVAIAIGVLLYTKMGEADLGI